MENNLKGIIILEGPDSCGKTTLAQRLARDFSGIILHQTYRFANKMHIYHMATLRKALKLSQKQLVILDRLHVSEYIYAKVYRDGTKYPWMLKSFNSFCKKMNIPIVVCIPETVERGIEWFNKAKQERPEMYDDVTKVIEEYVEYANKYADNKHVLVYNRDHNDEYDFYYPATKELIRRIIKDEL